MAKSICEKKIKILQNWVTILINHIILFKKKEFKERYDSKKQNCVCFDNEGKEKEHIVSFKKKHSIFPCFVCQENPKRKT